MNIKNNTTKIIKKNIKNIINNIILTKKFNNDY